MVIKLMDCCITTKCVVLNYVTEMEPKAIMRDFLGSCLETNPFYELESIDIDSTSGSARFESQFAGLEATIFLAFFTSEETFIRRGLPLFYW
jgi:hypothetical protein